MAATLLILMQIPVAGVRSQKVTFRTDDGLTLAATWFEPSTRPAPAVIFVHVLQKSGRDWEGLAASM